MKDIMLQKGRIFDIQKYSVHDGPGIRTIVFLKGCPLRCKWCCNPESQSRAIQTMIVAGEEKVMGRDVTVEEVMEEVLKDMPHFRRSHGGLTLSGGECLMQADFCAELLQKLKEEKIHTAVDTCGFVSKDTLDKVIPYTDLFLYDMKAFDEDVHIKCTGQSNKIILENLKYLDVSNCKVEIRIPFVPECNGNQIEKIGEFLSGLKNIVGVRILPYHNYAGSKYKSLDMENTLPGRLPTDEEMSRVKEIISSFEEHQKTLSSTTSFPL